MKKDIQMVATLKDDFNNSACWCISFDVVWKCFIEDFLFNDFVCKENELIRNLNEEYKLHYYCDKNDIYTKVGNITENIKIQILKDIKEKFNVDSDILKDLHFSKSNVNDIFIYSMFCFNSNFTHEFEKYKKSITFGKNKTIVDGFGFELNKHHDNKLSNQVSIAFYDNEDECAVKLKTEDNKSIYIYKTKTKDTFENVYNKMMDKSKNYSCEEYDEKTNTITQYFLRQFKAPDIDFKTKVEYKDLAGGYFLSNKSGIDYIIGKAVQSLNFKLNNKGASVKSEALMGFAVGCCLPTQIIKNKFLDVIIDDSFYIFITNEKNPLVAVYVDDIKNFIK